MFDKELIKKAIKEFHSKFYPEVVVEYIGQRENKIAFKLTGHYCLTCGMQDYFEDFAEILSNILGIRFYIEDKYPLNHGYAGWIVIYSTDKKQEEKVRIKFLLFTEKDNFEEVLIET